MRDIRDFKTKAFLKGAAAALARDGFVTDEHRFAPYRDVLLSKVREIQDFLTENGVAFELDAGELESPEVGPVFFIYDRNRFSAKRVREHVGQWIRQAIDSADA